jgi:hypothetical protein
MEIDDFAEPEIAITAAVTAAIFSPRARRVMRKGLVYGMAGMLTARDAAASFVQSVGRGVRQASATAASGAQERGGQAREAEMAHSGESAGAGG